MKITTKLIYAVSTGLLLSLAWPAIGSLSPILFVALVPLLLLDRRVAQEKHEGKKSKYFPYVWLSLFVFNACTTWWVWFASNEGAILAIILNSLFLAAVLTLAHFARLKLGRFRGDVAFISFWIAWEYFHLDWDLSWTWLNLGNGLANLPQFVQWYEYTGVFGGSLWILASNVLVVRWIEKSKHFNSKIFQLPGLIFSIKWIFWIIIPSAISLWMYSSYEEKGEDIAVTVIQPNIDPYNEKFNGLSSEEQVQRMFDLAEKNITPETQFLVFPETAIPKSFDEAEIFYIKEFIPIENFLKKHPNIHVVIGASTFVVYGPGDELSSTYRTASNGIKYDYCNTAVSITDELEPEFYHKSKMVPGVEKMPFPQLFLPIQELVFDLGGTSGSLHGQPFRTNFYGHDINVAPIICYESVFGEFVGDYVQEGASLLFIITNDGWWKDTPGYKQHALYAQLRAIEHRRSIARSANTGISCFINQRGETSQKTGWWVPAAISGKIKANTELTFYSHYGDILGRICLAFGILLLIFATSKGLIKK